MLKLFTTQEEFEIIFKELDADGSGDVDWEVSAPPACITVPCMQCRLTLAQVHKVAYSA